MRLMILATALLAACVENGTAGGPVAAFPDEEWTLVQIDGAPAPFTATANLGAKGRISGQAPCNRYFAQASIDGTAITIGPIAATRMMCLQAKGEAEFLSMLKGVDQVTASGAAQGGFVLSGAGHVLVFEQSAK